MSFESATQPNEHLDTGRRVRRLHQVVIEPGLAGETAVLILPPVPEKRAHTGAFMLLTCHVSFPVAPHPACPLHPFVTILETVLITALMSVLLFDLTSSEKTIEAHPRAVVRLQCAVYDD